MKNIKIIIVCLVLLISCLVWDMSPSMQVFASSIVYLDYATTDVMEDLSSSTIDGKPFSIGDFPKNVSGTLEVLTVLEYCYSYNPNNRANYALFVYVYNPAQLAFDFSSVLNKIQFASNYSGEDMPSAYSKYGISLCNKSTGVYENLFYKFKVIDTSSTILTAASNYASLYGDTRLYSVGEIELLEEGKSNATAFGVSQRWAYTGYLAGYGYELETTLEVRTYDMDALHLDDIHFTYYRPAGPTTPTGNIQDQLTSVYFSIPNRYLLNYGEVYSIHTEWYEYLTKEIFVVGNENVYSKLNNYIGKKVIPYNSDVYYGLVSKFNEYPVSVIYGDEVYNSVYPFVSETTSSASRSLDTLYYLFKGEQGNTNDTVITSEILKQYMLDYSNSRNSKEIRGKYSSDLFYQDLKEGRNRYNNINITADDEFSLTSQVLSQTWWQKFFGIEKYKPSYFDGIKGVRSVGIDDIYDLATGKLLPESQVCSSLYINENDYEAFRSFLLKASANYETTFLLRFAVTDYVSKPVQVIRDTTYLGANTYSKVDSDAYMAQQSVFLDFDIIDVTFYQDEVVTVIPVIASPIDVIPDVTPPVTPPPSDEPLGCDSSLTTILGLFLFILLFVIFLPLLSPVLIFLVWLVKCVLSAIIFPFKLIFKSFGGKS